MPDPKNGPSAVVVTVPRLGANDDDARIVGWMVKPGDKVVAGQEICEIETTKAVSEVVSPIAGYLTPLMEVGTTVSVNSPLAIVSRDPKVDRAAVLSAHQAANEGKAGALEGRDVLGMRKATRKAELLAARYGVDLKEITASAADGVIREKDVESMRTAMSRPTSPVQHEGTSTVERVLIIGSVRGGGAAIVVDILLRSARQLPAGVVDRDETTHGGLVLGVPVLGTSEIRNVSRLYESGTFDSAIIAFNSNLRDRAAAFDDLRRAGIPIASAIDVNAEIRTGVKIGCGNVIAGSSYVGAEARVGDNNFMSSRTTIEHHCVIGSHCGFGPAVTFSGRVKVGNLVRFGTLIAVEPDIEIGDEAVIASSCVLTTDVAKGSTVKAIVSHRTELLPYRP
jgi:acetyltransferase-like isoleucine patch superfamily enzyme